MNLNQQFQGLEVFDAHATVNVAADGQVVFAAGAFVRGLRAAGLAEAVLDAADAVEAAAAGLELEEPVNLGSSRRTTEWRSSRAAASRMRPSRHGSAGSRPATGCVLPGR